MSKIHDLNFIHRSHLQIAGFAKTGHPPEWRLCRQSGATSVQGSRGVLTSPSAVLMSSGVDKHIHNKYIYDITVVRGGGVKGGLEVAYSGGR